MTCESLTIPRESLFEATFIYKDPMGVPINLTGLVDNAEFTLISGDVILWTGTVLSGDVTPVLSEGRFDLLIPEADLDLLDFSRASFRFRLHWITKGWQSLATGTVIFDD